MSYPQKPVTIRDLARLCGFSVATISLALRNHPRISEATRRKVKEVAREVGYRINPLMAAHWETVRSRKSTAFQSVIAVITDWESAPHLHRDPWSSPAFESMSRRAEDLGYKIEEFSIADPSADERRKKLRNTLKVLRSRGIYAVLVLFPAHPKIYGEEAACFEEFATVFVWSEYQHIERTMLGLEHVPFHRSNPDLYGNMLKILSELRALGYRRPGFWPNSWEEALHAGEATAAFNFWILSLPKADQIPVDWTRWKVDPPLDVVRREFFKWLPRRRPDVVICQNFEVKGWIEQMGLRIPEDIGLVHTHLGPPENGWSGIDALYPSISAAGVDLLTSHLQRNERGVPSNTKDVKIEGRWVAGLTTASRLTGEQL